MDKFKGGMGVKKDYGWAERVMNMGTFIDFNDMLSGNYMQKMKLFAPKSAEIEPSGSVGSIGNTGGTGNTVSAAGGGVGGSSNFGGGSNVQPVVGMAARQSRQMSGEGEERVEANRGTGFKQYDGSKFEPNTVQGNVGTYGAGIGGVNVQAAGMTAGVGGSRVASAGTGTLRAVAYDPVKLIDKIELDSAIDEQREKEVLGRFKDPDQGQLILKWAKARTVRPTLTAAEKDRISAQGEGAVSEVQAAAAERQRLEFEKNVQNSTYLYELKEMFDETFPGIKRVKDLTKSGICDFAESWAEQNKLSGEETEFLREELPKLVAQDYPETFALREEEDLQAGNKHEDVFASDYRAEDAAVERVITEVLGEQGIELDEGSRREVFLRVRDKLDNAATTQERLAAAKELAIGEARFVRIRREAEAKLRGDIAAAVDPYAYYEKFKAGSFLEELAGSEKLGAAAKEELGKILADRAYDLASEEGRARTASVPDFTVQKMDRVVSKAGLSEEEEEGYLAGFEDEEQGQEILTLARSRTGFIELTAEEKRILQEQGEEAALTAVKARYRAELKKNMGYYTDYFRMEEAFYKEYPDINAVEQLSTNDIRVFVKELADKNSYSEEEVRLITNKLIDYVGDKYPTTNGERIRKDSEFNNKRLNLVSSEFEENLAIYHPYLSDEMGCMISSEMVVKGVTDINMELESVQKVFDQLAIKFIESLEGAENLSAEDRAYLIQRFKDLKGEEGIRKYFRMWREPRYAGGLEETV